MERLAWPREMKSDASIREERRNRKNMKKKNFFSDE